MKTKTKTKTNKLGSLRASLLALATCVSMGLPSCVTTDAAPTSIKTPAANRVVTAGPASAREFKAGSVPKEVADTVLGAFGITLGAVGWLPGVCIVGCLESLAEMY